MKFCSIRPPIGLAGLILLLFSKYAIPQTATNVRARRLADKTVEVLHDLTGAAVGGTTGTVLTGFLIRAID